MEAWSEWESVGGADVSTLIARVDDIEDLLADSLVLPKGYTQLEYIESGGTQYIDTGFEVNASNFKSVCFEIDQIIRNVTHVSVSGSGGSAPIFYIGIIGGAVYYGNGTADTATAYAYDYTRRTFKADVKNGTVSVSGLFSQTVTFGDVTAGRNMHLFGYHTGAGVNPHCAAIYGAKIYVDGQLARNFIPCLNASGEAGLFDAVTKTFYGNAGSGVFATGAEVEQKLLEALTAEEIRAICT